MILITGPTGNIGQELIRILQGEGTPFRAMAYTADKAAALRAQGLDVVLGNYHDDNLDEAVAGSDAVFMVCPPSPDQVEMQTRLIESARKARVDRLIKISAIGARIDATTRMGRDHAAIERKLQESRLRWTILRPHFFMQNILRFSPTITIENAFYAPMGDGRIGMVDARDVAQVAHIVLTQEGYEGQTYDLTGPESLSFHEVAFKLSAIRKRQITYVPISREKARAGMLRAGTSEWVADTVLELYAAFAAGEGDLVTDDFARVTDDRARSFDEFAVDYAEYFTRRRSAES
jgi:uncharacterized protein YbjT (DUF2867 family)